MLCIMMLTGGCAGGPLGAGSADRADIEGVAQLEANASLARGQIQKQLARSPDSELKESLQVLDQILAYAARVKSDPDQFDPEKTEAYNRKIRIIKSNIDRFGDPNLRTVITFPEGAYRVASLPAHRKDQLADLAETISKTIPDLHRQYPDHPIRITLKSIGYTDETPIAAGSRLEAVIRDEISDPAPPGPARRRQYNQILSRLRATHANQFVLEKTRSTIQSGIECRFVQKITGMGERLPRMNPGASYRRLDHRRRVCIVLAYIEIML
jgi:hypothetical protein